MGQIILSSLQFVQFSVQQSSLVVSCQTLVVSPSIAHAERWMDGNTSLTLKTFAHDG